MYLRLLYSAFPSMFLRDFPFRSKCGVVSLLTDTVDLFQFLYFVFPFWVLCFCFLFCVSVLGFNFCILCFRFGFWVSVLGFVILSSILCFRFGFWVSVFYFVFPLWVSIFVFCVSVLGFGFLFWVL